VRILRLDLLAFGPFTDATLQLADGRFGLHVVYGPNEAGKSSALRALRQFLYGIDTRSQDNFLHSYPSLRIGAELEDGRGNRLHFIRRKGNKDTLRGPDDREIADPTELERLLSGVDQDEFRQRFGIDHRELVEGSRDILRGGGHLGRLLFSTGAGLADLNTVQASLAKEAEELFKPQGTVPRLNRALAEFREARRARKEAQLRPADWTTHVAALRAAESEQAAVNGALAHKKAEQQRLERLRQAVPLIAKREHLRGQLQALGDVPLLPPEFAERRHGAMVNLRTAEGSRAESTEAIEEMEAAIDALEVPELLLKKADLIRRLQEELGAHRKAHRDRPELVARRNQLEDEARGILRDLGRDVELSEADGLRLTRTQRVRIQQLGSDCQALADKLDSARQRIEDIERQIDAVSRQLAALEAPQDTSDLHRALRRARRAGDAAPRLAKARTELQQLETQAEVDLKRLGLWSGPLGDLERLPLPSRETVERFEVEVAESDGELKRKSQRRAELEDDIAELDAAIEQHRLRQDTLTEEDLRNARRRRDEGWKLVRAAWQGEGPDEEAVEAFLAEYEVAEDLAQAYRLSVEDADRVADRLRRESKQVAEKARLMADRQKLQQRWEGVSRQMEEQERVRQQTLIEWNRLWAPLGIEPLSPREMLAWLRRCAELSGTVEEIRLRQEEVRQLSQQVAAVREELGRERERLGHAADRPHDTWELSDFLDDCEELAARLDAARDQRRELERDLQRLGDQLPAAQQQANAAEKELGHWRDQWAEAMAALELSDTTTAAEAHEYTSAITELLAKIKEATGLAERIQGIDRDAKSFASQVADCAAEAAPELGDVPPEQMVAELAERLKTAQAAQARLDELLQQRRREEDRLQQAKRKIAELKAELAALCEEAGCQSPEQLREVEQRSQQRWHCETQLQQVEDRLLELAAGRPLEELVAQANAVDADRLEPSLAELETELAALDQRRAELSETIIREEFELRQMDGSGRAAEADEEAQALLAQIRSDADQYVRLRLASVILQQAIERYREKNQGPVLQRAGQLFATLTLGSFATLRDDFNERGEPVLVGVRADGRTIVGVEAMSDGARDQLYLSLRLASLEHYLEQNEPIPFLVDDILVQFDDDRAAAALKVLGELADWTQVIFFTHHEHLVDLARAHVDNNKLFVQRLT
jgi:uncharacterized protein YhaN